MKRRMLQVLALLILLLAGCTPVRLPPPLVKEEPAGAKRLAYAPMFFYNPKPFSKAGIGLTYGHCEDVERSGADWHYRWSARPTECSFYEGTPAGWRSEAVPMLWGRETDDHPWNAEHGAGWLLGFNEPDRPDQANLTPEQARELWDRVEREWAEKRLVSPAPSEADPNWLERFYNTWKTPPKLDALAFHCYRPSAAECIDIANYVIGLAQRWSIREVWVTEWAIMPCARGAGNLASALSEAEKFKAWLDAEPLITRYAWFAARIDEAADWYPFGAGCSTALFELNGGITAFGRWYSGQH